MKNKLLIISRYNEDIGWLKDISYEYIIKNSTAGHEAAMLSYIYENYNNLPDVLVILQAQPFDHCNLEKLLRLLPNDKFISLESYEDTPENPYHKKDPIDNGYCEINNSWYVEAHNHTHGIISKYPTYDSFMETYFSNYQHLDWLRFSPGTQFIVPKENILYYSKDFWYKLSQELPRYNMTESFIIERAMYYIFTNTFEERK
jgi:hypothetical protein